MDLDTWSERYTVGDPLVDAYHRVFFDVLRTTEQSLDLSSAEAVQLRLAFLDQYAALHFESEEAIMATAGFPETDAHRELHRDFRRKVGDLQASFGAEPAPGLAREILVLMGDWWAEHILGEDRKMAPYVLGARPH